MAPEATQVNRLAIASSICFPFPMTASFPQADMTAISRAEVQKKARRSGLPCGSSLGSRGFLTRNKGQTGIVFRVMISTYP